MRGPIEIIVLALESLISASGNRPGNVVETVDTNLVAIGRADGTLLRLDNTLTSVATFAGSASVGAGARTVTYTLTGLREGQRAIVGVAWGGGGGATLLPSLGGSSPAGSARLNTPVTAAVGTCNFLSGAANSSGTATLQVVLTASAPDTFTVSGWASMGGVDPSDTQSLAFT